MGASVRPEPTSSKGSATEPRYPNLPATLPRILSPDEFEQGQLVTTKDLAKWNVPLAPPTVLFNDKERQQVIEGVKSVGHALANPVETAKHIGKSIIDDLTKVFLTPTVGARNDPDAKTGLLPFPNLPPGAVVTKENTPAAQTREEMHKAAINTSINAAFAAIPQLAAPARLAANSALGAYYDPEQPLRGATAGLFFGEALHGAMKAANPVVTRAVAAVQKARAAGPEASASVARAVLETLPDEDRAFIHDRPELIQVFNEAGFYEPPGQASGATVAVKPGTKIDGPGSLNTVEAVKQAVDAVGPDEFRAQVTKEIEKRGGAGDPTVEMAATEHIARQLAARNAERPAPHQMTRAEFEATGDDLSHGTTRQFDAFSEEPVRDTRGRSPVAARYYFTDKPEVARRFADSPAGHREVNLDRYSKSHEEFGESFYDLDPADQQVVLTDLRESLQKQIEAGRTVEMMDGNGDMVSVKDASKLTESDFSDGLVRVWKKGHAPRVIETKVYGPTLDLTGAAKLAPDVVATLEKHGISETLPANSFSHEFSSKLVQAAREMGYGKIAVPDVYESGFRSTIALPEYIGYGRDAHRAFVERAVSEGKDVPSRVLQDYPDIAARAKPSAMSRAANRVGQFLDEHPPGLSTKDVGNTARNPQGTPFEAALDDRVNVSKLGLSPEGEAQFRQMMPATGEKTKVTHAETEALARELEMDPAKLQSRIGDWSGSEALAARNLISQNTERIVSLSKLTQDMTRPIAEREAAQAEISRLTTDVSTMAKRLSGERSKAGRDLNALKIIAKNTMDAATWLTQAERVRGGLPLTQEHQAAIIGYAAANDRAGLISYVSKLSKTTNTEKALALWKAGLLTGLRTHEVNMVSNAAMAGLETAKDVPALIVDRVASLVTGERTVAPSFRGNVVEAARGVGRGLKAAKSVLQNGDPGQLERWDFRQTNFDNPVAQAYVDAVFRSLSAEDQIARGAAMGRALEEHLRLRARANAKADPSHTFDEHLNLLRQNPPDDVIVKAIADAEYAVFQNDNAVSRAVSAAKKQLPEGGRAAAEVVLPFVKTPTNVAGRMVDYSPVGFFTTLAGQLTERNQRKLAQGLGRAVTGSALVWLGFSLAAEGKATGQSPTSAGQRELQTMQGSGPNRVRMGGKWVDVSRVSPAGALVAVGAQLYHATKDAEGPSAQLAGAGFSLGRVVLDQPMVSGLSSVLDAAKDPQHAGGRFVSRLAGSAVPTIAADVASSMDPSQRDVKGVAGSVMSRIPGARETLPEKLDAFGNPLPNRNQGASAFANALNVSDANDDALVQELSRLKVSLPAPGKKLTIGKGKKAVEYQRTDEEIRSLKAEIGREAEERLRRVMAQRTYDDLSDDEKRTRLERVIGQARERVYAAETRRIKKGELAAKSTP